MSVSGANRLPTGCVLQGQKRQKSLSTSWDRREKTSKLPSSNVVASHMSEMRHSDFCLFVGKWYSADADVKHDVTAWL